MKKIIVVLLVGFILTSLFSSCGGNGTLDGVKEEVDEQLHTLKNEGLITLPPDDLNDDFNLTQERLELDKTFEPLAFINDEAEELFNLLIENKEIINADDVRSITLLDLDFDGIPELVVSRIWLYEYEEFYEDISEPQKVTENLIDNDIYRVRDGKLVYIDTIYNLDRLVYNNGNILSLKTLESGEKAWFNVSYKNRSTDELVVVDYLFILDGDELKFTEVFSRDGSDLQDLENASYYYFGEPLTFIIKHHSEEHIDCDCDPLTTEFYSEWFDFLYYNDFYIKFDGVGRKGRLFEMFKTQWCMDMSEFTINLNGNFVIYENEYWKEDNEVIEFNDLIVNEIKAIIANLVNDFYDGKNMFEKYTYFYGPQGPYAKPVIYLYPEKTIDVDVLVTFPNGGNFTCTYPDYNNGWSVTARPDGTLINKADGLEYSYLYWEGEGPVTWDFSSGFVVKGSDTVKFLQEKLAFLGLIPREYNEFIVYWLPLMQNNEYNLITFQTTAYEESAALHISPEPDSVLRIFMAYSPLEKPINIPEQQLESFKRTGFSVIEWGGACVG